MMVIKAETRAYLFINWKDVVNRVPAARSKSTRGLVCMGTINITRCHWMDFECL